MANIQATQTSLSDEWGTPPWLFRLLDDEFEFDLDAAATEDNALCYDYFTEEKNGLIQTWSGKVWLNCPYSNAGEWVQKAYEEAVKEHATTVMLLAARIDTRYWVSYVSKAEVRFLPGRLKFVGGKHSAPFPSAVVIFHKGMNRSPSTIYWNVREPK